MKTRFLLIALLLALAPAASVAQTLYVVSPPAPGTAPSHAGWTDFSFSDEDDGGAVLPLPFPFVYFGQTYTELGLSTNGVMFFGRTNCSCEPFGTSSCTSGPTAIPSTASPNSFVAFWWDDMKYYGTAGGSTTTSGAPGDRVFSIRFERWAPYSSTTAERSLQIDLHERSGAIAIYYGAISGSASNDNAVAGIENADGSVGQMVLACSTDPGKCGSADWPANQYVIISPAVDPDLLVLGVTGSALVPVDLGGQPGFSLDVTVDLKNQGQNPATGFGFDLYLSSDAVIDPATDTLLRSRAGPETLGGRSEASFTETAVQFVRPTGPGTFFLGAVVDPSNAVAESIETNNRGASEPYLTGADLTGSVSGPAATGPGDTVDLQVVLQNRGIDPAGAFAYEVWLSPDRVLDPTADTRLAGFPKRVAAIGGGQRLEATLQATMPRLANGDYYLLLQVDAPTAALPDGEIAEADETNNVVASSATIAFSAADLVLSNLRLLSAVDPFPELTTAGFGQAVRIAFDLQNAGGALASGFDLALYLSDNPVVTVYDQLLTAPGLTGLSLSGGETRSFSFDLTLPASDASGAALANGSYYLGLVADLHDAVPESSEWNNILRSPALALSHPSTPCADASECAGGPCVDGFCCDTACGGGDPSDCQACSTLAGAEIDGRCGPVEAGVVCRAAADACDARELCDGTALACPTDVPAAAGTPCDDGEVCTYRDVCDGAGTCAGTNACFADAGLPEDAGQPEDAGTAEDAGLTDAGTEEDAGVDASEPDAGQPPDAGKGTADAGIAADASTPVPDGSTGVETEQAGGCGCTTGAPGLDLGGLLLVLAALARRRR